MRKFELSFNNRQESFILPINPASIKLTRGSQNTKLSLVDLGEINLLGNTSLIRTSFSSFFPSKNSPHFKRSTKSASEYIELIKKWQASKRPIRFIITGTDVNLAMGIENFSYDLTEGSGDINYTLDLAEYRFLNTPSVKQIKAPSKKDSTTALKERPTTKETPRTYSVKSGDSLWKISKRELGDGARFSEIYNLNKALIDKKNGSKMPKYTIYAGQVLELPI